MKLPTVSESMLEIASAAINASAFTCLSKPTKFRLWNGSYVHLKVKDTKKLTKSSQYNASSFSFVTRLETDQSTDEFLGFGESNVSFIAVQKSISEAVERAIYSIAKKYDSTIHNTNGWAAHTDGQKAKGNAIYELLERDSVLNHWLTKTPLLEIDIHTFPLWIKSLKQELSLKKLRFSNLRIFVSTLGSVSSISVLLFDANGYAVAAHASSSDINGACIRAVNEVCRIAENTIDLIYFNESLELLNGNYKNLDPIHHPLVYAYHLKFPSWFCGDIISWSHAKKVWRNVVSSDLAVNYKPVAAGPLHVGYAQSPNVQKLYFGSTTRALSLNEINIALLRKNFCGKEQINLLPHCIG
ncbi:MAG: YcaO-like family protein [Oligoflexia bacterium]|nr:YcaO-like family protein [Oligoflexia bacterium]